MNKKKVAKQKVTKEGCRTVYHVKDSNSGYAIIVKTDLETGKPYLPIINWTDK